MASGMSAIPGIGRRNSITTDVASRSVREVPMRRPAPTPITIASARPWKYAESVSPISSDSAPDHSSSTSARSVDDGVAMLVS